MLHSRKLQYINEIVRCGSIRKAAARLNVASSAVNRQILALEEELGAPIFERLPRGLRLTAAGELCVEHIRDVLKNYEKLESRIRGLKMPQAGKVTLVTTVGLAAGPLPQILARFLESHPRVRIQLRNDGGSTTINPVLTEERYKKFFDDMVSIGVQTADLDYTKAFTTKYVCKGVGMALKK